MKIMKSNNPLKDLLREKGNLCVSVIIPVKADPFNTKFDETHVDEVIKKTEALILAKGKVPTTESIVKKLHFLRDEIDMKEGPGGIGLFISENISKVIHFPFTVKEKIIVDYSFEIRDVLYKEHYLKYYWVLVLTEKKVRLMNGKGTSLVEIADKNFPAVYEEAYEYSKPSRGSSFQGEAGLKQFEKDKSISEAMRVQAFYRSADQKLLTYIDNNAPLVLTGARKDISFFEHLTRFRNNIAGTLAGNYTYTGNHQIAEKVAEVMRRYTDKEVQELLLSVKELTGRGLITTGIKQIWQDAKLGKGLKLIVEKDISQPAFTGGDEFRIISKPKSQKNKIISDAVDDLIEVVLEKNGEVTFVDNGKLRAYGGMVLIKRY